MSNLDIGLIGIAAAFVLVLIRMPIGIALAGVSFCGLWAMTSGAGAFGLLRSVPYQFVANWSFSAIPMFLLMGFIASHSGLSSGLFRLARLLLFRVPGGLACSSVGACAFFAAASGSSVATAAGMGRIAIPEMRKAGYDYGLAAGSVAAAGTLGSLIPPSILMVIYGIFTEASISKLFMAGFVPGLMTAVFFILMIVVRVWLKPSLAPASTERPTRAELKEAVLDAWPLPLLILGVMGGIYGGVMTPTEAGAVGAALAAVIAVLRGSLSFGRLLAALRETLSGTSRIFVVALGASMFTSFMALAGLPAKISEIVLSLGSSPLMIILMISVIYLILGMFIESLGIMLLTLPLLLPLINGADINLIWFGVLTIKLLEIGLITPPFGMNVFVIKTMVPSGIGLPTIFKGVAWFIAVEVLILALLILFPQISLFLPEVLG